MEVGQVALLARYPVKSLAGEVLPTAEFVSRGRLVGDRSWAAYTADGGIASGKTTRRFRRVEGLLAFRTSLHNGLPAIGFPDGQSRSANDPRTSRQLSEAVGQPLELRPESSVQHHDESPVHLITTAALRELEQLMGQPVSANRFRANVVLDVPGEGFVEDAWKGCRLALGQDVVLQLGDAMPRCVMVGLPQQGLPHDARVLKKLAQAHELDFGLQAQVIHGGTVRHGDSARLS
jgi:uncharacterized protein YcbX